jgi:hypothetical protein
MRVQFERCVTSRSWCTKKCDSQGQRPAPQRAHASRVEAQRENHFLQASSPVLIRLVRLWIISGSSANRK